MSRLKWPSKREVEPSDYRRGAVVGTDIPFLVPSLCADCGGHVVTGRTEELEAHKRSYYSLGGIARALFRWTLLNEGAGAPHQESGAPGLSGPMANPESWSPVIQTSVGPGRPPGIR